MDLQGKLTQRGEQLLAAALSGGSALTYTRAAGGRGQTSLSAAALEGEQQTLAISDVCRTAQGILLPVTLVAAEAEQAYGLTEVGIYAQDGEAESLYAVYRLTPALDIDPADSLTVRLELEEVFAEAPEVSVTPAGTLTHEDLEWLKGVPGGIAGLDGEGTVPVSQMPYTCGTEELTPGETPLESGKLHFVYE